jgi:hypothetical protein
VNEANWTHRFAGTPSTWGVPGGQPGFDYLALPSAVTPIFDVDGYAWTTTPALVADLQNWVDHPEQNYGWMLISQQENLQFTARRFGSREALPTFNVPRLEVNYILVPEPTSGWLTVFVGGALCTLLRRARR